MNHELHCQIAELLFLSCNLKFVTCELQPVTCDLELVTCERREQEARDIAA